MKKILIISTFLLILIGLLIRNYHYHQVLFLDWDEGIYAQIAHEIIKNKTLITTFNNQLWLNKPPLSHLLTAFSFLIFQESEFYSRLVMVFLSFILLILLFFLTQKLFKKEIASLISVLVVSATPIFLERATMLNSDLLVAISWLGYFLFWEKYWLKLFFLTIGVWSKSVLGFYPLIFEVVYYLINVDKLKTKINWKNLLLLILFLLIPSLWYLFLYFRFGNEFINDHFLSQIFKRLYFPIELHFGNKFFYFNYLFEKLTFINFFIIFGYFHFLIHWEKELKNQRRLLIFLSPLPFLALLTIAKTKIDWYVIIFLPLLTIPISYLYTRSQSVFIKNLVFLSSVFFFIVNFFPQTYFFQINYQKPEKLALALCLRKESFKKLGFLVDDQERRNRQFLEATHYETNSSFYYGGSLSFVYYLNKPVEFFYQPEQFVNEYKKFDMIALSKIDYQQLKDKINKRQTKKIDCWTKDWLTFQIK